MMPILFLYMMQAAIETLHAKLTFHKLEYRHFPDWKGIECQNGISLQIQKQQRSLKTLPS